MMESNVPAKPHLAAAALYSLLFLFFFQLVSDFVEGIYVFGLQGTSISVEIVSLLLFLSPLVLLLLPGGLAGWPLVVVREGYWHAGLPSRCWMPAGGCSSRAWGVARFLIHCPSLLRGRQDREE